MTVDGFVSGPPGALEGVKVVELSAKGPAPFGAMILADLGAEVLRIDRPTLSALAEPMSRGRRSIALDLKSDRGLQIALRLIDAADVLIEGNRPGVTERLGLGPEACLSRNPALIYARMTGWGQTGPRASEAGHDINFLAAAGALLPLGAASSPPTPPLNLVGDFGGGALYLVIGVLAALVERQRSGIGQVIDAAMVDGVTSMLTAYHELRADGRWSDQRENNLVDGGAPSYRTYQCADGGYIAVGCLEPSSYRAFLSSLQLDPDHWPQLDVAAWPAQRDHLAELFATRTRDHWEELFNGTDACVSAVLSLAESIDAPHLVARASFSDVDGVPIPAVAPRLMRTPGRVPSSRVHAGEHTDEVLAEMGFDSDSRAELRNAGVVA